MKNNTRKKKQAKNPFSQEEWQSYYNDYQKTLKEIENSDLLDYETLYSIESRKESPEYIFLSSLRNAPLKSNKYFLGDKDRVNFISNKKRSEAILTLREGEKLSEIIDHLPHGLIDKKATGIGATYLEMHSKRDSIIVTPTRALAINKSNDRPDCFLYVGTKEDNSITTSKEIKTYLNNSTIEYKKILVVADSLNKVIDTIISNQEDVYKNYFLMVDEIDTLQSDNHYRPVLSNVIDYYFKFKLQRRALVSATVKQFSHPNLEIEPLSTICYEKPLRRAIQLLYTDDVNQLLASRIQELFENTSTNGKILIAYNSVKNILETIKLLPNNLQEHCGILCSEMNTGKIGLYKTQIENNCNSLKPIITFMTCTYFVGIDISNKCHMITVSNVNHSYSILSINRIKQIYGRCRNGVLSDTIIYNSHNKDEAESTSNIDLLKSILLKKGQKVIDLLNAADNLKMNDSDITDLFDRIQSVIMERATENLLGTSFKLVRENIDKEREISYFNIDTIGEKLESYYKLYSFREGLYKELLAEDCYEIIEHKEFLFDNPDKPLRKDIKEEIDQEKLTRLLKIKEKLIELNRYNHLNEDTLIRLLKRTSLIDEVEFYIRIKTHFHYIEIEALTEVLYKICTKNKKSYRILKNAISFWVLDDLHPFKSNILQTYKVGYKYTSKEIEEKMQPIIKYHFFKTINNQNRLISFFNSVFKTTRTHNGYYKIVGLNPKKLPQPINLIPANKMTIQDELFEI